MSSSADAQGGGHPPREEITKAELEQIRDALRGLRYGSLLVTIQDGLIVQIDRTEKRRLRWSDSKRAD